MPPFLEASTAKNGGVYLIFDFSIKSEKKPGQ